MFKRAPLASLAWLRTPAFKELSAAYYAHHFHCRTCISAGQGVGNRCNNGSELWNNYKKGI